MSYYAQPFGQGKLPRSEAHRARLLGIDGLI